ncbi:amidase [Pseudoroseicyclus sp. CXY001]|uniref:amidase n=1 Tax=Pseudoroseicyclus sp. CXY001 TaxID=3242492 RepID=UPI00358DC270
MSLVPAPDLAPGPDLSIAEAGAALRAGRLTAAGLLDAHLARIRSEQGAALHAVEVLLEETARAEAAAADAAFAEGRDLGPLHGIPVGVKALFDVAGLPTTGGSRVPAPPAAADSAVVARLRAGGAVVAATLATYEFATVGPDDTLAAPPARNPWNPAHVTGGSSSGSAAAVAGGLLRATIGTDTGGSIRSPAAFSGVVGLKPSHGRVSAAGLLPLSPSLDHAGPLAATVGDAALALDAVSEPGWRPAAGALGQGAEGLTIGYARAWLADDPMTDRSVLKALDDAASVLSLAGARIREVVPPEIERFKDAGATILAAEAMEGHRARIMAHGAAYGRAALKSLLGGLLLTAEDLALARRAAALLTAEMDETFAGIDALLTATTLAPAPKVSAFAGGRAVWTPMRTLPFNVTGHPALSLPCGFAGGLPIGAQLVARKGAEDMLCRIGHAFEMATDVALQRPPGFATA